MTTVTISLSQENSQRLRKAALRARASAEELASARLEAWLKQPGQDFQEVPAVGVLRYLTLDEVSQLHQLLLVKLGGGGGRSRCVSGAGAEST